MKFNQLNKKHIIAAVLVVAICLGIAFVSCNRNQNTEPSNSTSTPTTSEEIISSSDSLTDEETGEGESEEENMDAQPSDSQASETTSAPSTPEVQPSTSQPQSKPESSTAPSVAPQPSPEPAPQPSPEPVPQPSPEPSPEPSPQPPAAATPTCSELFTTITSDGNERPSMQDVNDNMLSALYGIDASLLEDYCAKVPLMNVKVNEIAILKVKDSQNVSTVKAALQSRKDSVVQQFQQYLPDQLEIAKAGVVGSSGNYVYLILDPNASSMESALVSALK